MEDKELKKLAKEFQNGLNEIEEIRKEMNNRFDGLSYEEFQKEYDKYIEEILEDAKTHKVKIKDVKNKH